MDIHCTECVCAMFHKYFIIVIISFFEFFLFVTYSQMPAQIRIIIRMLYLLCNNRIRQANASIFNANETTNENDNGDDDEENKIGIYANTAAQKRGRNVSERERER